MNTKIIWVFVAVMVVALAAIWIAGNSWQEPVPVNDEPVNDTVNDEDELSAAEQVERFLDRLPHEVEINHRAVVFDQQSIDPEPKAEYAALPYEVEIGGETQLVEAAFNFQSGEDPIGFVERYLESIVPHTEAIEAYPDTMYQYQVSIYPLSEEDLQEYPAEDHPEAGPADAGVAAYVRAMNFPDDSVGGGETRFDFIKTADNNWFLVWQGERVFCRRPDNEFWAPATELCP